MACKAPSTVPGTMGVSFPALPFAVIQEELNTVIVILVHKIMLKVYAISIYIFLNAKNITW